MGENGDNSDDSPVSYLVGSVLDYEMLTIWREEMDQVAKALLGGDGTVKGTTAPWSVQGRAIQLWAISDAVRCLQLAYNRRQLESAM